MRLNPWKLEYPLSFILWRHSLKQPNFSSLYWILTFNSRSSNGYSNESLESLNLSTEDPESDREMDIEEENEEIQNAEEENSSEFHNNKQKSEVEVDEIGDEVEPWRLI